MSLNIHVNDSVISSSKGYSLNAMNYVTSSTYRDLGVTALVECEIGDTIRLYASSGSSSINVHCPNNKMIIYKVQST